MKLGFDNEKYLSLQSEHIRDRLGQFGGKLYMEFGGKLFDDFHAARVLPGFEPDSKIRMLMQLADHAEIVIVINAADIEKNKVRGDLGITYDLDVMRLIDAFRSIGLYVGRIGSGKGVDMLFETLVVVFECLFANLTVGGVLQQNEVGTGQLDGLTIFFHDGIKYHVGILQHLGNVSGCRSDLSHTSQDLFLGFA